METLIFTVLGFLGCVVLFVLLVIVAHFQERKAYRDGNKMIKVKGANPYKGPYGGVYGSNFADEYGRTDRWKNRYLRYGKRRWK